MHCTCIAASKADGRAAIRLSCPPYKKPRRKAGSLSLKTAKAMTQHFTPKFEEEVASNGSPHLRSYTPPTLLNRPNKSTLQTRNTQSTAQNSRRNPKYNPKHKAHPKTNSIIRNATPKQSHSTKPIPKPVAPSKTKAPPNTTPNAKAQNKNRKHLLTPDLTLDTPPPVLSPHMSTRQMNQPSNSTKHKAPPESHTEITNTIQNQIS